MHNDCGETLPKLLLGDWMKCELVCEEEGWSIGQTTVYTQSKNQASK